MENRRGIINMIVEGKTADAIAQLELLYPSLLIRNKELALMVKCQQFIEMLREVNNIDILASKNSPNSSPKALNARTSVGRDKSVLYARSVPPRTFRGTESYAQVFTQTGRSLTITSNGTVVGTSGTVNPFKRRCDEADESVYSYRRTPLRSGEPDVTSKHSSQYEFDAAAIPDHQNVDEICDEPMEEVDSSANPRFTDVASASNGASHANGDSVATSNGNDSVSNGASHVITSTTTIVTEENDDDVINDASKEYTFDQHRVSGYTKAELAPFERLQGLLDFGKQINTLSTQLVQPPKALIDRMHGALALICHSNPRESSKGYLFDQEEREAVAKAVNSAILEFLGYSPQSLLSRHFHTARELRNELTTALIGAATFADIDRLVQGEQLSHCWQGNI
ncbi:hypothetical protein AB6A40_005734 [Gnathostoma spinigerum]|uniref:CTLH domain-containing protein n=1 Tax=Gnathostoma spinigerum TaxID=75299 RepID=A0ABD6EG98_9BILA